MNIEINLKLFEELLRRVSAAIKNDPRAAWIRLDADKSAGTLSVQVLQDNLLAHAYLDAKKVPVDATKGPSLSVGASGVAVVNGKMLIDSVASLEGYERIELSFQATKNPKKDEEKDGEEKKDGEQVDVEIGKLVLVGKDEKGEEEKQTLIVVDKNLAATFVDAKEKVVLNGKDFSSYLKMVAISVGQASANVHFANLSVTLAEMGDQKKKIVTFVTTNGQQISVANFEPAKAIDVFPSAPLPYDLIVTVSKMVSQEQEVSLSLTDKIPVQAIFRQDIFYGAIVGECKYQVTALSEKYPSWRRLVKDLSYIAGCKINRQTAVAATSGLSVHEQVRTQITLSGKKSKLLFDKAAASGESNRGVLISDPWGEDVELDASSRHLALAVRASEIDEMVLELSGRKSIGRIWLTKDPPVVDQETRKRDESALLPNVVMYFQPFAQ